MVRFGFPAVDCFCLWERAAFAKRSVRAGRYQMSLDLVASALVAFTPSPSPMPRISRRVAVCSATFGGESSSAFYPRHRSSLLPEGRKRLGMKSWTVSGEYRSPGKKHRRASKRASYRTRKNHVGFAFVCFWSLAPTPSGDERTSDLPRGRIFSPTNPFSFCHWTI